MRSILILTIVALFLLIGNKATAQVRPLHIGDKIPKNLLIKNVLNYPGGIINLDDYGEDLVILDFMSIHCGSCVQHLPYYDSLQRSMPNVKIFPVSTDDTEKADNFLKRKDYHMAFATQREEYLAQLFPYKIISHLVWIKGGKVEAITESKYVTDDNVKNMISSPISLPLKQDQLGFNVDRPLLINDNGGTIKNLLMQSTFTSNLPGVRGGIYKNSTGLKIINAPVILICTEILSNSEAVQNLQYSNRMILEVNDSIKEVLMGKTKVNSYFTYSLTVPESTPSELIKDRSKEDLNAFLKTYFKLRGTIESRKVESLVLYRSDSTKHLRSSGGKVINSYSETDGLNLKNVSFSTFFSILSYQLSHLRTPLIDQTGFSGSIDIHIAEGMDDPEHLQTALKKYGLDIKKEYCDVDMIIISPL